MIFPSTILHDFFARFGADPVGTLGDLIGPYGGRGLQQLTGPQGQMLVWSLALILATWWLRRRAHAAGTRLTGRLLKPRATHRAGRIAPCRWRVGSMRMASGVQKWRCETCGLDGFSSGTSPPSGCNWRG
jgi:hypothetical protein